jgi:hypothetical protein
VGIIWSLQQVPRRAVALSGISARDKTHSLSKIHEARCQWLTPVIMAIQEAEIRRIVVQRQPRQIVHETLS